MSQTLVDLWLAAQLEANAKAQAYLSQYRQEQAERTTKNQVAGRKRLRVPLGETDANTRGAAPIANKKMRATRTRSPAKRQQLSTLDAPDSTLASMQPQPPTSTSPQRREAAGTRRSARQRPQTATSATLGRSDRPTTRPPPLPPLSPPEVDDLDRQLAQQLELGGTANQPHFADDDAVRSYAAQLHRAPSSSLSSRVPSWAPSSPSKDSDIRTIDTRTSQSTTTRRRARSPVKTISDMSLLDKPCISMSWSEASKAGVLNISPSLRRDLEEISQNDQPVVPRSIESSLREVLGEDFYIPSRVFGDSLQPNTRVATREFDTIQDIVEEADRCVSRRCCEAQWNAEVHSRVLKLALHPFAGRAEYDCITSAAPLDDLVPTVGNTRVQAKYIDYTISLVPTTPEYQNAIRERLRQQLQDDAGRSLNNSSNPPTINQSGYFPIHDRPLAISIETKTPDAGEGGALAQLALWIACGHRRIYQLTNITSPAEQREFRIPSSPVLRVVGHTWTLGWAVDLGDRIALVDFPHEIGHTRTLVGVYRLLASLRRVVRWADGEYRQWFGRVVLGVEGED